MPRTFPALPATVDPALREWARQVESFLYSLPFSIISTAAGPNVSGVTAPPGWIAIELASSATTRLWQKYSASTSTTGWSAYSRI